MAYDLKNQSNVMNSLLSAFNNNRPLLYNTTSLLGIAGSGKSFVLIIAKKKLQEILNNVDFVSVSATEKNLADMKSKLNINGDLIKPFLENLKTGLGETAEIINNTFIEIATEWYNTLD
jgi:adenylate kinase